jgi:hypothetical protein
MSHPKKRGGGFFSREANPETVKNSWEGMKSLVEKPIASGTVLQNTNAATGATVLAGPDVFSGMFRTSVGDSGIELQNATKESLAIASQTIRGTTDGNRAIASGFFAGALQGDHTQAVSQLANIEYAYQPQYSPPQAGVYQPEAIAYGVPSAARNRMQSEPPRGRSMHTVRANPLGPVGVAEEVNMA